MARTTFTQKFLQHPTTSRPLRGERLVRDKVASGLALKITPEGPRAFLFIWNQRTPKGYLEKRIELCAWSPDANLSKLRATAIQMRDRVKAGHRPSATSGLSMQELWEKYLAQFEVRWRASTVADSKGAWKRHIAPTFAMRTPESITRSEVIAWHHAISVGDPKQKRKPAPGRANRVLATLKHLLNYATHDLEIMSRNPAIRVKMNEQRPRETYLSEQQLRELWRVLEEFEDQRAADAVRLAVLTGQRRREVLGACFSEFDLDRAIWSVPAERDKAKRGKSIMLPVQALEVVRSRLRARSQFDKDDPRRQSPFLFTETGDAPLVDLKKPWAKIRKAFKMPTLRFHDLRHSFASMLINRGVPLFHVGQALGHTQSTTTQRYAHVANDVLRRAALEVGNVFDPSVKNRGAAQ